MPQYIAVCITLGSVVMSEEARVPRGFQDAVDRLNEQLRFVHSSGAAFDRGDESEAKRISSALRIIWKTSQPSAPAATATKPTKKERRANQRKSLGLAVQVGFKGMLIDTSVEVPNTTGDRRLIAWGGPRPAPLFAGHARRQVSFEEWWNGTAIKAQNRSYSRKEIVLAMCEMDGGGHVDEELIDWYYGITRRGEHGVAMLVPIGDGTTYKQQPAPSPIGAIVRQIGHETLMSLASSYEYDGTDQYGNGAAIVWAQATVSPFPDADGNQSPDQVLQVI